jgi:HEAT repeat protein
LGKFGDARAVEPLVAALKDDDFVRQAAAKALAELRWKPDGGEAAAWFWVINQGGNWAKKCLAIGTAAVEPLIAALKDKGARGTAAGVLGEIGDPRAVEPLVAALKDEDESMRNAAALALGQIGAPAVEPLIAMLKGHDWRATPAAIKALGEIGDARAVEPLIAILPHQGKPAAEALGKFKDPRAVDPLIAVLSDGNCYAAEALGIIKDPRAVAPLIAALNHKNENLRKVAARSLVWIYKSGELKAQDKKAILSQRRELERLGVGGHTDTHHDDDNCLTHDDYGKRGQGFYVDFPV